MIAAVDGQQVEVTIERFIAEPSGEAIYIPSIGGQSMSGHVLNHYLQCVVNDQYGINDTLGPGMVAIDIGASVGMFALAASKLGASVIAFEPEDRKSVV